MTTINEAWNRVFAETDVLAQIQTTGFAYVAADSLKRIGMQEPRLMAKLDTLADRPDCFKQNSVNILPVRNGQYVLFSDPGNKSFFSFANALDEVAIEEYNSSFDFGSLDSFPVSRLFNESQAIDYAFLSSLLNHALGCGTLHLSIRGRLFSGTFGLTLPGSVQNIDVTSVQMEIDAGYETTDSIVLIEAKIGKREDFNVRQLVYPFLQWSQKSRKRIRPVLLMYSNSKYYIAEFLIGRHFGEIDLSFVRAFTVNESKVASIKLTELRQTTQVEADPLNVPFPQANDLDKIVDLIQLVSTRPITKVEISDLFEFDERQADYYANAAAYLGFVQRLESGFSLTSEGQSFVDLSGVTQRTRAIVKQMMKRASIRMSISLLAANNFELQSIEDVKLAEIVRGTTALTGTTPLRRASTVRQWLRWLLKNCCFTS